MGWVLWVPPNVEYCAIEVDLIPAEVAQLSRAQPVPESHQDHGRIPVAVPVLLGGLDQGVDFAGCEVFSSTKLGVRSPCRCNCSKNFSWRDQLECRIRQ